MSEFHAQIEAIKLIKECENDVYKAYAIISKRITVEMTKWPQNIDWSKVEKDKQIRAEILDSLAYEAMLHEGWSLEKEYEFDLYPEWRKDSCE